MSKTTVYAKSALRRFVKSEEGATAIEYGLFAALIAAVIVGVVATLGTGVQQGFQLVVDSLPEMPD